MKKKMIVVGGGASGMVAAICAARAGAQVLIIESQPQLGKKILATGNGRCNFSNTKMSVEQYYTQDSKILKNILESYPTDAICKFFADLGVMVKNKEGYLYPTTEQATTIRNALASEIKKLAIEVRCEETVINLKETPNQWTVTTTKSNYQADGVILSVGSKAGIKDVAGVEKITKWVASGRHNFVMLTPSLVSVIGCGKFFKKLGGIRTNAKVSACIENQILKSDVGELQLTEYGLSGIPVFQISHILSKGITEHKPTSVIIDFMPELSVEELEDFLAARRIHFEEKTMGDFMNGLFKDKLNSFFLYMLRVKEETPVREISDAVLKKLASIAKTFSVDIKDTNDFSKAQVCSGGVPLHELSGNLESNYYKHLFVTGELLDVDGICGGYNLHFAWATGMLAGYHCTRI